MYGSRIKEITFTLENCDNITIPGNYIGSFCVTDIKKYISRLSGNYIGEYDIAESFFIEIHRNADMFHKQFGEIQNFGYTKFKRLTEWNDITDINFEIEECWDDGKTSNHKYSYKVIWHDEDEFNNRYQKTHISTCGHLYIVISTDKEIFDVFDKEEIEDIDWMDSRFDMMDVSSEV